MADVFFLIGLIMKLIEYVTKNNPGATEMEQIDQNNLAAAGRILWGAAFSLAILKTIKVPSAAGFEDVCPYDVCPW
jgi:hypothetical protein